MTARGATGGIMSDRWPLRTFRWRHWTVPCFEALLCLIVFASGALAQDDQNRAARFMVAGMFMIIMTGFVLAIYIYMAICLQTIAKKTNVQNPWLAWIPIANII